MNIRPFYADFVRQAELNGHKIAVQDPTQKITYADLFDRSLRWAKLFDNKAGGARRPIAVLGDKGLPAIEAVLAAVLTGRAYSFLSPSQKRPRLMRMMRQLRPSLVVDLGSGESDHDPSQLVGALDYTPSILSLHDLAIPSDRLAPSFETKGAAYVLFTSGSTGEPSGVIVSHLAAAAAQRTFIQTIELKSDDIVASEVALNFDVSTFDVFSTLAVGGTVDLTPESIVTQPASFLRHIEEARITSLFTVPTVARQLLEAHPNAVDRLSGLRRLMLTGELISNRLAKLMSSLVANDRVYNLYGMTEAPWALGRRLRSVDLSTPNQLDTSGPTDIVAASLSNSGEVLLAGEGVFSGYVDERTDFEAPIQPMQSFATGDFAEPISPQRWRFMGRRDKQIRRDGYRIELREIENWIEHHVAVETCCVKYDEKSNSFIAFVNLRSDRASARVSLDSIRSYAERVLPYYMVPDRYVPLAGVPRTTTGKVDYTQLTYYSSGYSDAQA